MPNGAARSSTAWWRPPAPGPRRDRRRRGSRTLPDALARTPLGVRLPCSSAVVKSGRVRAQEIARAADAWAETYHRGYGLRRGDVVALIVNDAEQFLTAFLGAAIAGVVPATLYPPSTATDRPRYLDATARVLRASRALAIVTRIGRSARPWTPCAECSRTWRA